MKKVLSILLALCLICTAVPMAFAADNSNGILRFNDDGKFTIINICDIQEQYPMSTTSAQFIREVLAEYKPDIVVLGGDNTVGPKETKAEAIKELCSLFTESGTYFTLVFGNHDAEQGVDKDTLLAYYKLYGGRYCLAYDALPSLTGTGTHNLPVLSSDGTKIAYNLYMFDSNMYATDENGKELGYDCVHTDQIDWYKNVASLLKTANGGSTVYSMAFQHIIVQEAFEELFYTVPTSVGGLGKSFDGVNYIYLPKVANITDGMLLEAPCPGYYNYGQFDAMVETGDVVAIFSGHDHINTFTVNKDGIDIVNTAGCTYNSYGKDVNRGCRVITLDENDLSTYTTESITICEAALKDGSSIIGLGEVTAASATFNSMLTKFMNIFVAMLRAMLFFTKF